ncbi:hypothetical protein RB195_011103 [Necator americanus]|uniref:Uncharacterized protein n=1 Tax=Necator americanus TaxID=51031 RepID=A0ABR1D361_NECAM
MYSRGLQGIVPFVIVPRPARVGGSRERHRVTRIVWADSVQQFSALTRKKRFENNEMVDGAEAAFVEHDDMRRRMGGAFRGRRCIAAKRGGYGRDATESTCAGEETAACVSYG